MGRRGKVEGEGYWHCPLATRLILTQSRSFDTLAGVLGGVGGREEGRGTGGGSSHAVLAFPTPWTGLFLCISAVHSCFPMWPIVYSFSPYGISSFFFNLYSHKALHMPTVPSSFSLCNLIIPHKPLWFPVPSSLISLISSFFSPHESHS